MRRHPVKSTHDDRDELAGARFGILNQDEVPIVKSGIGAASSSIGKATPIRRSADRRRLRCVRRKEGLLLPRAKFARAAGNLLRRVAFEHQLGNFMDDPDRFRTHAERCRKIAKTCANPLDKEAWLKLGADWLQLAELREGQPEASRRQSRRAGRA
jgi:hypothetical protein